MSWLSGGVAWLAANKDSMIAMGALVSPVTAVVASLVSYRAVVTGPRIQREIARDQFELSSKQLALQERAVALAEAQMSANLLGGSDQRWIENFRDAISELGGMVTERGLIQDVQKQIGDPSFRVHMALEIGNRIDPLVAKIHLMVGPAGGELTRSVRGWVSEQDTERRRVLGFKVSDLAWEIIEQKQTGITARLAAVSRTTQQADLMPEAPC